MTATVTEKSRATLRRELDRRSASRETLTTEISQAKEKLSIAMDAGDTAVCVRLQGRLQALEGLRDQETRLVDRLTQELTEHDAKAAEEEALDALVAVANQGVSEERERERLEREINDWLKKKMPGVVDRIGAIQRTRIEFIAKLRDLGMNMGTEALRNEWVEKLEARGADLSVVLAAWVGTPITISERYYEVPIAQPYGAIIPQMVGIVEHQRAHEKRVQAEQEAS